MLISERVNQIVQSLSLSTLATLDVEDFRRLLDQHFVQVARDQRHTCVEALTEMDRNAWSLDAAMSAVMNAPVATESKGRGSR